MISIVIVIAYVGWFWKERDQEVNTCKHYYVQQPTLNCPPKISWQLVPNFMIHAGEDGNTGKWICSTFLVHTHFSLLVYNTSNSTLVLHRGCWPRITKYYLISHTTFSVCFLDACVIIHHDFLYGKVINNVLFILYRYICVKQWCATLIWVMCCSHLRL